MAAGMPGMPPPEPTSIMLVAFLMYGNRVRLSKMWWLII